jgi:hypothetical protein
VTEWLVLAHQVPSRPSGARVRVWRRLQQLGALGLRNAVYVLPAASQSREDFEWLRSEIEALGGHATVFEAQTLDAASRDEIVAGFRDARRRDYDVIRRDAERLLGRIRRARTVAARRRIEPSVRALRERWRAVHAIDYFEAPGGPQTESVLATVDRAMEADSMTEQKAPEAPRLEASDYRNRRWVTRPRPGIDRMSSAWLIRRFIDPSARFVFADTVEGTRSAVPFDMYGVEFGHQGSHCTYETLAWRFGIDDPAAAWIGRIVHDLDLKEERYSEPEAPAVARLVDGLRRMHEDDAELLERGSSIFEALYQSYEAPRARKRPRPRPRSTRRG